MLFLFLYSIHLVEIVLQNMTIKINFKKEHNKKAIGNIALFVEDNFNNKSLYKHFLNDELSYVQDLLKNKTSKKGSKKRSGKGKKSKTKKSKSKKSKSKK